MTMKYDGFALLHPKVLLLRNNLNFYRKIATKLLATTWRISGVKLNEYDKLS
jgi:hypothetical protein